VTGYELLAGLARLVGGVAWGALVFSGVFLPLCWWLTPKKDGE
jgi:hypothetical protein